VPSALPREGVYIFVRMLSLPLWHKLLPIFRNYYMQVLQTVCKQLWLGTGLGWMEWEGAYTVWVLPNRTELQRF